MRDRKKTVDRQSLANIHIARFIDELNQALEEAYRSGEDAPDSAEGDTGDEGARNKEQ
jgi:hypothetical protein